MDFSDGFTITPLVGNFDSSNGPSLSIGGASLHIGDVAASNSPSAEDEEAMVEGTTPRADQNGSAVSLSNSLL